MIPEDEKVICTNCWVDHVENCPQCLGFGIYQGKRGEVPLSASEANTSEDNKIDWQECPTCGGTPYGVKKEADNE